MPHATGPKALTAIHEDEALFRKTVRHFAAEQIAPLVREMDEAQHMDPALIRKLFALGLMGIEIPEEYGGSAGTFFEAILAVEEISAVDPSVGVLVDVQNTLCINALLRWANAEQKGKYLPKLATGTIGAYALSEAASGSDAFALQTRATRHGDTFVLNGQKLWITNAKEAGVFIVFATLDPALGYKGITAFLVEKDTPGLTLGRKEDKLGIRASSTCELIFRDCVVPASQLLGEPGKGYKIAIETLNEGRIGIAAQMVGLAQGAWGHAAKWATQRKQFGKPLAEFQAMQFQLAEMATSIEAARLLVYNAARLKDSGEEFLKEAAMAKVFASQVAEQVASLAVEIFGGSGFVKDYPVEKLYRDAKIGKIYEGTSFMQYATIAKLVLAKVLEPLTRRRGVSLFVIPEGNLRFEVRLSLNSNKLCHSVCLMHAVHRMRGNVAIFRAARVRARSRNVLTWPSYGCRMVRISRTGAVPTSHLEDFYHGAFRQRVCLQQAAQY